MKHRMLGNNVYDISEIGLGCWQLGNDWSSLIDQDDALEIMRTAVDHGVTFFDTANVYGSGRSEKLIGRFLRETNETVCVATKYGRGDDVYPDNYTEDNMKQSVQDSMKRLGVDYLDLLQLHCVPTDVLRNGRIFDWLRNLKKEGLIRHFGASVETVEEGLICLKQEGLISLQVIFNLFRQKLVTELLPQAKEKGVGIIARLPLASGLLSGKFKKDSQFSETDHRHYNRDGQFFNVGETFAGLPFDLGVEMTEKLKVSLPDGMSMVQMALRWILDHKAVSVIIPGASSPDQARGNASVSDIPPLSEELNDYFSELYKTHIHQHIRGNY